MKPRRDEWDGCRRAAKLVRVELDALKREIDELKAKRAERRCQAGAA